MFPSYLSTRAPEHLTLRTRPTRFPERYDRATFDSRRRVGRRRRRG